MSSVSYDGFIFNRHGNQEGRAIVAFVQYFELICYFYLRIITTLGNVHLSYLVEFS